MLGKGEILHRLPHRDPMLLVDNVQNWQEEQTLHAQRTFVAADPLFQGHFPGHPVVPGVLLVEALAQSAALLVNLSLDKTAEETLFFFMGVENARFKHPVGPDDVIDLQVQQTKRRGTIFWFDGQAVVDGKVCATASFSAKLVLKEE